MDQGYPDTTDELMRTQETAAIAGGLALIEQHHAAGRPELAISPAHQEQHDVLGAQLDPRYADRSPEEQRFVAEAAEIGWEAEAAVGIHLPGTIISPSMIDQSEFSESRGTLAQTMAEIEKSNEPIVNAAIKRMEFVATPEVAEAVKGYYNDHEKLLTVVERFAAGEITTDDASRLEAQDGQNVLQHSIFDKAYMDLVKGASNPDKSEATELALEIISSCYNETCLGASTLTMDLIEEKAARIQAVEQKLKGDGHRVNRRDHAIARTGKEARGEVRHAGQLLFHNSPYNGDLESSAFKLMGRSAQTGQYGASNANTAQFNGYSHTNVTHFSELYDPAGYKQRGYESPAGKFDALGGTLAIPIAEVVKAAPYGRSFHYGILEAKPGSSPVAATEGMRGGITGSIGAGASDMPSNYLTTDRVFLADNRADHILPAHNYQLDCGVGAMHYNPDTRIEENVTYRIYNAQDTDKADIDPYSLSGAGYGYPKLEIIEVPDPDKFVGQLGLEKRSEPTIRRIQEESRSRSEYKGKYVVPLRGMTMEFADEGNDHRANGLERRYVQQENHAMHDSAIRYAPIAA